MSNFSLKREPHPEENWFSLSCSQLPITSQLWVGPHEYLLYLCCILTVLILCEPVHAATAAVSSCETTVEYQENNFFFLQMSITLGSYDLPTFSSTMIPKAFGERFWYRPYYSSRHHLLESQAMEKSSRYQPGSLIFTGFTVPRGCI